jgi:RimJ/RimL family protein N-acetyltransferase
LNTNHDTTALLASYSADAILRNGDKVFVRAINPNDKADLLLFLKQLDRKSLYYRFFEAKHKFSDYELNHLSNPDFESSFVLIALPSEDSNQIIGMAQCSRDPAAPDSDYAEVAFIIHEKFQGKGLGTLFLENLAGIARQSGINEFRAQVLGSNSKMFELFSGCGFTVKKSSERGITRISFPISETPEFLQRQRERRRKARQQYLLKASRVPILKLASTLIHGRFLPLFRLFRKTLSQKLLKRKN